MKNRNLKKNVIASVIVVGSFFTLNMAQAAKGKTDVSFDFPSIIILHYTPKIDLSFKGKNDLAVAEDSYAGTAPLAPSASFDAGIKPDLSNPTYPKSIAITVKNVWAVRGITPSGKIGISSNLDEATAKHIDGDSAVVASNFKVSENTVPATGLNKVYKGGILFDLNLDDLKKSGKHTGMVYTITAKAL